MQCFVGARVTCPQAWCPPWVRLRADVSPARRAGAALVTVLFHCVNPIPSVSPVPSGRCPNLRVRLPINPLEAESSAKRDAMQCIGSSHPAAHICSGHPAELHTFNVHICVEVFYFCRTALACDVRYEMEEFSVNNFKKDSRLFSGCVFVDAFSHGRCCSTFFWAHPLREHPYPPLFLSLFLSPCWSLFRWSDNGEVYLGNIYSTV